METQYKALFFDIDGTLVPFGDTEPPREVIEALADVRRRGVKVFIATGRHIDWVKNLGDLEADGYVTVNGGICLLSDRKTRIYCYSIPQEDTDRLADFGSRSDLPMVIVPADGGIFQSRQAENIDLVRTLLKLPDTPIRPLSEVRGMNLVQAMAFDSPEAIRQTGLLTEVMPHCVGTSWHPIFCDIVPKGSNKAVGIDRMLEHFGLRPEEAVAFGDGDNDIEMLRHVGMGIAMGNSAPQVKEAADMVTADVRDGGIVKALATLRLL